MARPALPALSDPLKSHGGARKLLDNLRAMCFYMQKHRPKKIQ